MAADLDPHGSNTVQAPFPSLPLAGRDNEVGTLEAYLDGMADGAGVILLDGEAGIGKTRLLGVLA